MTYIPQVKPVRGAKIVAVVTGSFVGFPVEIAYAAFVSTRNRTTGLCGLCDC